MNNQKRYKNKITENIPIIGIILIGIVLRGFYIDQPMRYDESLTFLNYVNNDWSQVFNYTQPNNHVLNTILIKLSTLLWGSHPFVIRLSAFLFGVASIPIIYLVCKRLGSLGYIAALILAVHPYCILFSTNARGYSAIVFFSLLYLLITIKITEKYNLWDIFKLALIGSLGLLSIPIMVFPLSGITLWLMLQQAQNKQNRNKVFFKLLLPLMIFGIINTLILYAPVVWFTMQLNGGLDKAFDLIFNNEFVKSSDGMYFFHSIRAHVTNAISIYFKDIPKITLILLGMLFAIGTVADYKQKNYRTSQLFLAVILSTLILFILKHQMPYPRTWIFLIPFFSILIDRGFTYVIQKVKINIDASIFIIIFLSVYWSFTLISKKSIYYYADTGTYLDAEIMAKKMHLILNEGDSVVAPIIPSDLPFYFYLWHEGVYNKFYKRNSSEKIKYIMMPNEQIKLEMFSLPPHPIDVKIDIIRPENAVKIFEFNGSAIYRVKSEFK